MEFFATYTLLDGIHEITVESRYDSYDTVVAQICKETGIEDLQVLEIKRVK